MTPESKKAEAVPRLIMSLGRRYVQYINRARGRPRLEGEPEIMSLPGQGTLGL